ncbi:MAG: SpoIIE family protein phosphatase [Chitinispirillaceae bacterium]|nr:SpoIIE family protein phosphatase [Chitinispirillaceae bacterium]
MDEIGNVFSSEDMPNKSSPAIGFLTESLNSFYQSYIWMGASEEAVKRGYTLQCFAGGSLKNSPWDQFEPQRNTIYNFINTRQLKGLIVAGSLGNFVTEEEFAQFYSRFTSIPMVCLGPEIKSVPAIVVDNVKGMRDLVAHLVEVHSCSKIAFLRGPQGNQEAEQRYQSFRDALLKHGIQPEERLIVPGDFSREAGVKAVQYLYNSKLHFDALVCANDDMALGALKMFHELHIKVPDEVLLAGFDDIEECSFSSPPLTTVHQPLFEMGARAVDAIIEQIDSGKIQESIVVPATIAARHSCGCYQRSANPAGLFDSVGDRIDETSKSAIKKELVSIICSISKNGRKLIEEAQVSDIAELFCNVVETSGHGSGRLLQLLSRTAWALALLGGDVTRLVHAVAVMRQFISSLYKQSVLPVYLEDLIQNAELAIVDAVTRAQAHRRMDVDRHSILLRDAGQSIASAFDLDYLLDVIATEVIKMNISGCWVALYDNPERSLRNLRLALEVVDGRRLSINPIQSVFTIPDICPDNSILTDIPRSLLIEPLFFRDDQIGIIIFDVKNCMIGYTYEVLRLHLSSALKGALLVRKVQEQAQALEIANRQLQKLRDSEHAYLEGIKHELELGREIQASFLPREMPNIKGWELCPAFQPARAVSGDFYDVFMMPDGKLILVISDVSGKDVGAALFMALIKTLIRALAEQALSGAAHPLDAIQLTNHYLINHHYGNNGRYMYATCFMAQLDFERNRVTYVNAGHNPPALITSDGVVRHWIEPTGPAVGIIPEGKFEMKEIAMEPGELLFCYTDGITEARSPDGSLFSKKRLASILSQKIISASDIVNQVDEAVKIHGAGKPPFDDITILALRRKGLGEDDG